MHVSGLLGDVSSAVFALDISVIACVLKHLATNRSDRCSPVLLPDPVLWDRGLSGSFGGAKDADSFSAYIYFD
jgi:hypothetical protein